MIARLAALLALVAAFALGALVLGGVVALGLHHGGRYDGAYRSPPKEASRFVHVSASRAAWSPQPKYPRGNGEVRTRFVACDHVNGDVLAESPRWLVIHAVGEDSDYDGATPVVACRRQRRGPVVVRLLAVAKWDSTNNGEDSDPNEGGPYLAATLAGNRLLVTTSTFTDTLETDRASIVDLATGTRVRLPGQAEYSTETYDRSGLDQQVTHITSSGAVIDAYSRARDAGHRVLGPVTIWDATGPHALPGRYDQLAPVGRSASEGLYLHGVDGRVTRIAVHGAARLDAAPDRALAWRLVSLPSHAYYRDDDGQLHARPASDDDRDASFNIQELGNDGPWLRYSGRGNHDPKTVIRIAYEPGGAALATLAPHSRGAFKTLDGGLENALVVGRFTTDPGRLRLKLIGHDAKADRFFDRPATAAMVKPGNARILDQNYDGTGPYAVYDGRRLLFFGPHGAAVHPALGLHDIETTQTISPKAAPLGVFATDAAGKPRLFAR